MVVIVDGNQIAQLEMASSRGGLTGDTLHGTAITKEDIGVIVGELIARLVEHTSGVSLGNGKTDCVGEALSERAGSDFNTGSIVGLRMTRSYAVDLLLGISQIRGGVVGC